MILNTYGSANVKKLIHTNAKIAFLKILGTLVQRDRNHLKVMTKMICSSRLLQLPVCTAGGLYLHPTGLYFHLLALPFCATGVFHPPSERCLVYLLLSLHSDHFPLHGYCCERRLCALPPSPSCLHCGSVKQTVDPHFPILITH